MKVNVNILTRLGDHEFCVEASTLGFPPGTWPAIITVEDEPGVGQSAYRDTPFYHDGEFAGYQYSGGLVHALRLKVFND